MNFRFLFFLLYCLLCQTLLKSQDLRCFTIQGKSNLREFCLKGDAWHLIGHREGFIKLTGDTTIYMYAFDKHGNGFATVSNIRDEMNNIFSKELHYSSEILYDTTVSLGQFKYGLLCKKISMMERIPIVGGLHQRDYDTTTRDFWIWEGYQHPGPFTFLSDIGTGLIIQYETSFTEYAVENNQLQKIKTTKTTSLIPKTNNNPSLIQLPGKTTIVSFKTFMEKLGLDFKN